jgi:hypothetical protein
MYRLSEGTDAKNPFFIEGTTIIIPLKLEGINLVM